MAGDTYSVNGLTRRQRYELLRTMLTGDRSSWDAHWRELSEFMFPRRTQFTTSERNRGERRSQNIINSTPRMAVRTLQSGLHAGLTSPARPWMKLTTPDPDLSEHGPVKEWLHSTTQRMLTVFLRSNIYNVLPIVYGDMGVFAVGAMGVLEDERDLMRCYSYPIGSYAFGLDDRGVATTFLRDYRRTVRQLVEQFGVVPGTRTIDWTRLSVNVKTMWDAGEYEKAVDISWVVTPNELADRSKLYAKYLPWSSCWFEQGREDDGKFLRESGFRQFPVLAPRWDVTGEDTYGTDSPGMTALGDTKGLQLLERRKAQAIDKALNPPLVGSSSLRSQKTSLLPGDITYEDVRDANRGLRPIHEVRLEGLQYVGLEIERHERRVERAFYADLFLMLASSDYARGAQPITAEEVKERHEEKLLALGPVLERLNDELLDPLVDRVFAMMLELGAIPEPPEELQGIDLKVEYLSIMAQAQKLVGVTGQDRYLQSALMLAERFPAALHKVNVFQALDDYADMLGVNPKLNRSDEEANASLQAEAQAQASEQQAQQLQRLAQGAAALGKTPIGGNTALDAVLEGAA